MEYDSSIDLLPLDEEGNLCARNGHYIGNYNDEDFDKKVEEYYEDSGLNEMLGL
jgi:hypothetical protein